MAEKLPTRIENSKQYFRYRVDCGKHGDSVPAFRDWDGADGLPACLECQIDTLTAMWLEGGEEDWAWLPKDHPQVGPTHPVNRVRSSFMVEADKSLAKYWSKVVAETAERYSKSPLASFINTGTIDSARVDITVHGH